MPKSPLPDLRICGTALSSIDRIGRFQRFAASLTIAARVDGAELEVALTAPSGADFELPAHLGITLLDAPGAYPGVAHAYVELQRATTITCRIPARGRAAGGTARFALTWVDAYSEVERPID